MFLHPSQPYILTRYCGDRGVHSITTWLVKEDQKQDMVLESTVTVTSNRMLMGFIKTTLQESHETLVKEFVAVLEKELEKAA
jgi:hypothetical protein